MIAVSTIDAPTAPKIINDVQKVETLIIGAGVVGSSLAMHLAEMGMKNIRVLDFDLEGSLSSSELNAGGVRATWNKPLNVELSKFSIDYYAKVASEVGYRDCGYVWLYTEEAPAAKLKSQLDRTAGGWPAEIWDIAELKKRLSFVDKTEGIACALSTPRDGLINPNLLKNYFRSQARARGVVFDDRTLVTEVNYSSQKGPFVHRKSIHVVAQSFESVMSHETKVEVLSSQKENFGRRRIEYHAERLVNCAGPWAAQVAKLMHYPCPSVPLRRQVSVFDCREVDLSHYGMIVDTSGVYFHPEATNGLAGFANRGEPPSVNFTYDGEDFFNEYIWPALYERSTYFERLKHLTGWAGLYEVSPDESAIIGLVETGDAKKSGQVFEAHSFSGHGVMQSYGAGFALAEKIVKGMYEKFDLSELSGKRFEEGKEFREDLII